MVKSGLEKLVDGVQIAAVVCMQYGDTGKGKIVDLLASQWADVIARGTGGNNAGHTVIVNEQERIYHLLPAGITYDSAGKTNVLGSGMVIDPFALCHELDNLEAVGGTYNNLRISEDAGVIMPWHIESDRQKNKSLRDGGIGSTGRGIGPAYADKTARIGIDIRDLFDRDTLAAKIKKMREIYPGQKINTDEIIDELNPCAQKLEPFVTDTVALMHDFIRQKKRIVLEGAQGTLLSIEHGVKPYVTSSDSSINGTAGGVGLSAKAVDLVLGIVKFPFMTRVGGGPFVTELGGKESEEYCAAGVDHDVFYEVNTYLSGNFDLNEIKQLRERGDISEITKLTKQARLYVRNNMDKIAELMNSDNEFIQGVGIRLAADEYGATTQRPRRIGWTDAVAARYAIGINAPLKVVLTKPDSVVGVNSFEVCFGHNYGEGKASDRFSRRVSDQRNAVPILRHYKGFGDEIRSAESFSDLPAQFHTAIEDFEGYTEAKVAMISTGPDKESTIIL